MRTAFAVVPLVLLLTGCTGTPKGALAPSGATAASARSQDERMAWWRDARFGMFIHWGLYAIPAGEWKGETRHAEWIRTTAQIPLEDYEKLLPRFDPVRFDADAWARAAADAGMKYLVITSKHHDGFCLYDSELTDWDVASTPFRRDILGELAAACRRHGVRFCTYHSIMDWHHPDYLPRRGWEKDRPEAGADFARFRRYLHGQVREVVTRYRPAVMWFDGEWESTWTHAYGLELFDLCRSLDPAMIVNNRVDVHRGGMAGFSQKGEAVGDFGTPEQEIPATGMPGVDWETCMTMNDHWGYNRADRNWKSTEDLVRKLVDIASKGGNFLLNVGPQADGTFPDEAIERLHGIGQWMTKHGEAIYGTSQSPFDAFAFGRCTVKRDGERTILYLHVFHRPASGELVVPGIGNEPVGAGFLAGPRVALPVERRGNDLVVRVPMDMPDPIASVVRLTVLGAPIVYRSPTIAAPADVFVRELRVTMTSASPGLVVRYTLDGSEPVPTSPRYEEPLVLRADATVAARAFHEDRPVTSTVRRGFRRVTPWPAAAVADGEPGLRREKFAGDWDRLPDFAALTAIETAVAAELALPAREERVGYRFTGFLEIEAEDAYELALACDDGGRLWIDDRLVVDNDGLHSMLEKRGVAPLARGLHALRVEWFNKTGGAELTVRIAPLGGELVPLAPGALRHSGG